MTQHVSANNHGGSVAVGLDFGTLSGRAVVVRVSDGAELGTAVMAASLSTASGACSNWCHRTAEAVRINHDRAGHGTVCSMTVAGASGTKTLPDAVQSHSTAIILIIVTRQCKPSTIIVIVIVILFFILLTELSE